VVPMEVSTATVTLFDLHVNDVVVFFVCQIWQHSSENYAKLYHISWSGRKMRIFYFCCFSLRVLIFYNACGAIKHMYLGFTVRPFKSTAKDALMTPSFGL
jgi:hypothetical protein